MDIVYGPEIPESVYRQQNSWSCAVRATYAALWVLAQKGLIPPVSYGDDGLRDVYNLLVPTYDDASVGLHDATGAGIVQALRSWGIEAHNKEGVTIEEVRAKAGKIPVLIGGRAWNHWVYVRGVESDGTLILANPAGKWMGIGSELLDSFTRLGPFSMVWIPVPDPGPVPATAFSVGEGILYAMTRRGEVPASNEEPSPGGGWRTAKSNIGRTYDYIVSTGQIVVTEGWGA
jgi:hypothetical protein